MRLVSTGRAAAAGLRPAVERVREGPRSRSWDSPLAPALSGGPRKALPKARAGGSRAAPFPSEERYLAAYEGDGRERNKSQKAPARGSSKAYPAVRSSRRWGCSRAHPYGRKRFSAHPHRGAASRCSASGLTSDNRLVLDN